MRSTDARKTPGTDCAAVVTEEEQEEQDIPPMERTVSDIGCVL
eukprot:CAMPEP_0172314580 /NCGR_PEP_ID=MMETSP1058-20130122/22866_1 /TAXON_ID=83371 /ORGANISM="Detonula confervacea, Strain CCMP 353" /LENGTH=42 /DNA_ID= /DNA_START= /DNA_END= /DNA_ORIENTATION=